MNPQFASKPELVQLTELGAVRIPGGSSWMVFDVDSVSPNRTYPGLWIVYIRDYRYGKEPAGLLGRDYQVLSLAPGDYEPI